MLSFLILLSLMWHSSAVTLMSHNCKMQKYICKTSINSNCWYLSRKKSPSRMIKIQYEWHYRNLSEYYMLVWLPACTDTHTQRKLILFAVWLMCCWEVPKLKLDWGPPPSAHVFYSVILRKYWAATSNGPQLSHPHPLWFTNYMSILPQLIWYYIICISCNTV